MKWIDKECWFKKTYKAKKILKKSKLTMKILWKKNKNLLKYKMSSLINYKEMFHTKKKQLIINIKKLEDLEI